MKISDLEKVQEYLYKLKHIRDDVESLARDDKISVSLSISYRQDLYIKDDDVISKIADLVKEHLKKQEQEIINKLLELGVEIDD